ncbi:hypothetical protein C8R44DRAFT_227733 [Mycena epipterygia]|nr:hypothetical protein C8R44DRAFT_227733 [Mycena epipterygia]
MRFCWRFWSRGYLRAFGHMALTAPALSPTSTLPPLRILPELSTSPLMAFALSPTPIPVLMTCHVLFTTRMIRGFTTLVVRGLSSLTRVLLPPPTRVPVKEEIEDMRPFPAADPSTRPIYAADSRPFTADASRSFPAGSRPFTTNSAPRSRFFASDIIMTPIMTTPTPSKDGADNASQSPFHADLYALPSHSRLLDAWVERRIGALGRMGGLVFSVGEAEAGS